MLDGLNSIKEKLDIGKLLTSNLFLKNYYVFHKHVVPFLIAALLLFMLSFSGDNVASSVLKHMSEPINHISVAFLIILSILFYYYIILSEIRHSYLSAEKDILRSLLTAILGIITCTAIVFIVLYMGGYIKFDSQGIISCVIISILSLLGIGLPMPTIGIELPNYTYGRYAAREVGRILGHIDSGRDDFALDDFCTNIAHLKDNVFQNLNLEYCSSSREEMDRVHNDLEIILKLIAKIKEEKTSNSEHYVKEALKGTYGSMDIFKAKDDLSKFFPEWPHLTKEVKK
jgi:hypothetical protein